MKPSELDFITIGRVLTPLGNRGKVKVEVLTDFPDRFSPSANIYIHHQPMSIESAEFRHGIVIIKLKEVDSVQEAERLRGALVEIHHSQFHDLPEGQYYHFQLIGLEVKTTQGDSLGKVTDILTTPGNDIYVVKGLRGEVLIPALDTVVKNIQIDQGYIIIEPVKGLLDR